VNKISEIFKSWVTAANPSPEEQAIAQYRANVCDSCDKKTHVAALNTFICSSCGCPLSRKIFSPKPGPEACPLAKWEK
jgi:ribosomal protein L37E